MVDCQIEFFKKRSDFKLCRSGFIVAGLGGDAKLPQFALDLVHKVQYPGFDRTEIVIFKLLVFRRRRTEKGASGLKQIGPLQIKLLAA